MLTEVMRYYELTRAPVDLDYFETEHHTQLIRDLRALIAGGRLIALTAVIGSNKTLLMRRLRDELGHEGRVSVSRSLTLERSKLTVALLVTALFYDFSPERVVTISRGASATCRNWPVRPRCPSCCSSTTPTTYTATP